MQEYEGAVCQPPPGGNITVVVAKFNETITRRLLDGALAKLREHKVHEDDIRVAWVPGAYEIPLIADHFANDESCMAVICLGAVIKGETSHDEHINRYVSMALGEIACRHNVPVIFGLITCDTVEQAMARSGIGVSQKDKSIQPLPGNKGAEAAEAALAMIDLFEDVPAFRPPFSPMQMLSQFFEFLANDDDDGLPDFPLPFPIPPGMFIEHKRKTAKKKAKTAKKTLAKKSKKKAKKEWFKK